MGKLSSQPVFPLTQASRQVSPLYHAAFPKEERPPYSLALLFACRSAIDFRAYYDGETFVGFAYTERTSQGIFLFLFAIADDQRSRGYGSAILGEIAEQAGHLPVILCIEPLDQTAGNYPQRLKRLAFYEKNGYRRQYLNFHELTEVYEVLATADGLDYQRLAEELNQLSLGLLRIRIVPEKA